MAVPVRVLSHRRRRIPPCHAGVDFPASTGTCLPGYELPALASVNPRPGIHPVFIPELLRFICGGLCQRDPACTQTRPRSVGVPNSFSPVHTGCNSANSNALCLVPSIYSWHHHGAVGEYYARLGLCHSPPAKCYFSRTEILPHAELAMGPPNRDFILFDLHLAANVLHQA